MPTVAPGPASWDLTWRQGDARDGRGRKYLTLTFTGTLLNEPARTAVNETNSGGHPGPVGTKSTPTTLVLDGNGSKAASLIDRDVVSYLYVGY